MNNFWVTEVGAWGDGSVHLTKAGVVVTLVVILLLWIVAAIIRHKNAKSKAKLTTKQLVFSAMAIALAVVCSMIKVMEMPMGGSITLLSMLFIVLIAYWYGPYAGIMTAVAYGLVQFVVEPIFYTVPQMLFDYPLAFGALGLAGFFNKKRFGLQIGYLTGVIGRYVFATISGVLFFGAYAPEGMHPLVYSLVYQASYIVPEAVLTLLILCVPQVAKALAYVKNQAVEEGK
ncbi:MAG: energy-coupled thiamine transporter ThiT [Lachnospiraceae bacterium]|nr:energy-coupled thiamine transporter ThiT [Lachnospiraceae bacterium]